MADEIERLAVLIEANTAQFTRAMQKLEQDTRRATRNSAEAVEGLSRRLEVLGEVGKKALEFFGVGVGIAGFLEFIKKSLEASENIEKLSSRLGISAEAFQKLTYVAEQSGASQEDLVTAFKGMSKFLGEVERGSKTARAELAALGLSFDDLKSKSPDKVLELLLDRVGKIANPIQRAAVEMKLFGKSGQEIDELARQGAAGIERLSSEAQSLGLVLSDETISKGAEGAKQLKILGDVSKVAGQLIATEFVPVIRDLVGLLTSEGFKGALADLADDVHKFISGTETDLGNLMKIYLAAKAEFSGLSSTDQPFQAKNSDEADRLAASAGKFRSRFAGDFAESRSGSVTSADILRAAAGPQAKPYVPPDNEAQKNLDAFQKQIDAIAKRTAVLNADTASMTESVGAQEQAKVAAELYSSAAEDQIKITKELADKIDEQAKAYGHAAQMADDAKKFYAALDDLAGNTFDEFNSVISGAKSAGAAVKELIVQLLEAEARADFIKAFDPSASGGPLSALFGSLFGGARASGGPVSAGRPYLVGEHGPELFVPNGSGRIAANGTGGGSSISFSTHIDARGASPGVAEQLGPIIERNNRKLLAQVQKMTADPRYRPN